jgi:hypothetical protein
MAWEVYSIARAPPEQMTRDGCERLQTAKTNQSANVAYSITLRANTPICAW